MLRRMSILLAQARTPPVCLSRARCRHPPRTFCRALIPCRLRASKPLVGALGEAHVVLGNNLAVVGDNSFKFCGCRMPNAEEPGAGVDDISGRPVRNVA